jgi:DNA-binding IclR family transcriptional regulator
MGRATTSAGNPAKDTSQTLARGLRVLDLIAEAQHHITIREVASQMALPRSVVQRLVSTLEAERFLERDPEGGYRLSLRMWSLGCAAVRHRDLREIARPVLRDLSLRSKETVKLSVVSGLDVITLDCIVSEQTVRAYIPIGGRVPANVSATGRAVLAFMLPEQLSQHGYCETGSSSLSPAAASLLKQVRARGFAVNRGEIGKDTAAVAAPVFSAHGEVIASVGIILPVIRLTGQTLKQLSRWVKSAADEISAKLGYRSPESIATLERA